MALTIATDFDGTLAAGEPLVWLPGAHEAVAALHGAGHRLILHSCRCNPVDPAPEIADEAGRFYRLGEVPARVTEQWRRMAEMRAFLQAYGAWEWFDVWAGSGKPPADRYVDDRCEPPDWSALIQEFGTAI